MKLPSILVFRWVEVSSPERAHAKLLAFQEGDDIATVYVGNATYHAHLAEAIRDEVGSAPLFAAGDINKDGEITSWKSSGFSFETPEDAQAVVGELIRHHMTDIQDLWAR